MQIVGFVMQRFKWYCEEQPLTRTVCETGYTSVLFATATHLHVYIYYMVNVLLNVSFVFQNPDDFYYVLFRSNYQD